MTTARTAPGTAHEPAHPSWPAIVDVLRPGGPVASVYLGPPAGDADAEWPARWHALARRLHEHGTSDDVVRALGRAVARSSTVKAAVGPAELAAFAGAGGTPLVVALPGLDGPDLAGRTGPAHLVPLLSWAQQRPPYLLVVTDRAGADFEAGAGGGAPPRLWSVSGPDDDIERNTRKSPLQRRYLHRAEDSWRHNAGAVARAAAHALERSAAELLVVSGDVRAVHLLLERLPAWVHGCVDIRHITGSRHADGSQRARPAAVAEAARDAAAGATARLLSRFAEQRGPGGLGVEGAAATLDALARGRLAVLLVDPAAAAGRTAWYGAAPTQVRPASDGPPSGWDDAAAGPLVDVAVRTALLTGAQVRVLAPGAPAGLTDGIGGLCRYRA